MEPLCHGPEKEDQVNSLYIRLDQVNNLLVLDQVNIGNLYAPDKVKKLYALDEKISTPWTLVSFFSPWTTYRTYSDALNIKEIL
jgi:hypothetical protein